jgi:hypothetical protein
MARVLRGWQRLFNYHQFGRFFKISRPTFPWREAFPGLAPYPDGMFDLGNDA